MYYTNTGMSILAYEMQCNTIIRASDSMWRCGENRLFCQLGGGYSDASFRVKPPFQLHMYDSFICHNAAEFQTEPCSHFLSWCQNFRKPRTKSGFYLPIWRVSLSSRPVRTVKDEIFFLMLWDRFTRTYISWLNSTHFLLQIVLPFSIALSS